MTAANALLRALLTMERKSLTSMLSSSLFFLPGSFIMLLILAVQSAKIRFYIEKAIFLFTFFYKSLVISIDFTIFAASILSPKASLGRKWGKTTFSIKAFLYALVLTV